MKGKIKILHLIAPTQFGGAEKVILSIAHAIDNTQFHLMVGSFVNIRFANNTFVEELEHRAIPNTVFWLKRTLDIDNIFRIVRFIRKNKIDIIHTHGYRSDILGLIAAKMTTRPIVSTIHGWIPINSRLRFYERCDRFALRFFDWLVPVSNQIRELLIESGIAPGKVTRLHNAVDVEIKQPKTEKLPSFNIVKRQGDFLIGTIGRLSPEKDIPNFLQTASLLVRKYDHLKFLVVGDGPERKNLETMAFDLGLKDKIQFTGFIDEIDSVYPLLDLLVISSRTEGIPLVLLEAMKYSIPVVSTNVGGIGEVVDNGINGLLVSPDDVDELTKNLELLIKNKKLYVRISIGARKKIENKFDRRIWIKKIEKIYRDQAVHY